MSNITREQWYWGGYAGHFCAASSCLFRMHTRVGNVRVSTVGDWHPMGEDSNRQSVGYGCDFETYVFRVVDGAGPEGVVIDYSEIDSEGCNDSREAEAQHYAMCEKWAAAEMQAAALLSEQPA